MTTSLATGGNIAAVMLGALCLGAASAQEMTRLSYNHPGLVVDLGVGLWAFPLPMDYDQDGDLDLVVACPDRPYNGVYFFENPGGDRKMPIFKPAVRLGAAVQHMRVSHVAGEPRVLAPAVEFANFLKQGVENRVNLPIPTNVHLPGRKIRANQWHYLDFDDDGALDVVIGVDDWQDYGWDDGYDAAGKWLKGPLRGYVYLVRNEGTTAEPKYGQPTRIHSLEKPIETFGWPSPNFADFDGDGDLDLVCGEFLDKFTYFQNIGSRKEPLYARGRLLTGKEGTIRMDLEMIVPSAIDWDGDGDADLIVGDEDGRVAFIEHTGEVIAGLPQFLPPRYFQQQADVLKCGALATPVGSDWDGDGDEDLVSGNTAGYIEFFENLGPGSGGTPKWNAPVRLRANDDVIRIESGPNGSIQGPCEAKWGYTTLNVADWNHDGTLDIVANSIWGKVVWYEGQRGPAVPAGRDPPDHAPSPAKSDRDGRTTLKPAQPIEVEWSGPTPKPAWTWWEPQGKQLVTQWRTTPVVVDFTGDKLNDLVMLDHEGYLALFERKKLADGSLALQPPRRIFVDEAGKTLRLNAGKNGKSGRRKLCATDWDGDGRLDFLLNGTNADFLRNISTQDGLTVLKNEGPLAKTRLDAHDTSPTTVDWNRDGQRDLVVGAEDGHLYYLQR